MIKEATKQEMYYMRYIYFHQISLQNVILHIKNIYADGELYEEATCKDCLQVQKMKLRNSRISTN